MSEKQKNCETARDKWREGEKEKEGMVRENMIDIVSEHKILDGQL